jgi:hypothetical protein
VDKYYLNFILEKIKNKLIINNVLHFLKKLEKLDNLGAEKKEI